MTPITSYVEDFSFNTFMSMLDKAKAAGSSVLSLVEKETYENVLPIVEKILTDNPILNGAIIAVGGGIIAQKSFQLMKGAVNLISTCKDYFKAYFKKDSDPYFHRTHDRIVNGFGKPEEVEACRLRAAQTLAGLIAYNRDPVAPVIMASDMGYAADLFASRSLEEIFDKIERAGAEAESVREKLHTGTPSDTYTSQSLGKLRDFRREIIMDDLPADITDPFEMMSADAGPPPETSGADASADEAPGAS